MLQVCLVGLGSIGQSHLRVLEGIKDIEVHVIDTDPNKSTFNSILGENLKFYTDIQKVEIKGDATFAVISNWGPNHFESIMTLHDKGVTKFLVEKPLVSSIEHLEILAEMVNKKRIKLYSNFSMNFTSLISKVEFVTRNLKLGELCSISVTGGAKCLVTNGIHYLALANNLFNSNAVEVYGMLKHEPINPRSRDFLFLGGSSSWVYRNHETLSISFTNNSHNQLLVVLEFRFGRIILEGDSIKAFSIPSQVRDTLTKPNLTGYPRYVQEYDFSIAEGDSLAGMKLLYSKMLNGELEDFSFSGVSECQAIFGMLISDREGVRVSLPLSQIYKQKFFTEDWKIS